ncbi:MAG: hypothetical protein ACKVU4_01185 [Phycisphaerales bacterium]
MNHGDTGARRETGLAEESLMREIIGGAILVPSIVLRIAIPPW